MINNTLRELTAIVLSLLIAFLPLMANASASPWTTSGTRTQVSQPDSSLDNTSTSWSDYHTPKFFPNTVTLPTQFLTMDDGTQLAAYVTLPADEDGNPVISDFPTILVISDYNVPLGNAIGPPLGIFMGAADPYLVKRGYASVSIDGRGTGNSGGVWDAWGESQADYIPIIDWVVDQSWSNGAIGLRGVSDLGINALFAAQTQHPAIKAVFAAVPLGDGYRDTVFTGGNGNLFFISLWFSITTLLNTLNPELLSNPEQAKPIVLDHLKNAVLDFQLPIFTRAALGDPELKYDGPFWQTRSPIERASDIQVPTFLIGAVHDIFQRGVPALYEQLKHRVPSKLIILPGSHIDGAFATTSPDSTLGLPPFNHIELQWFDRYLKGEQSGAEDQPQVTQYMIGLDQMAINADWPAPQASANRFYLRGNGQLSTRKPSLFEWPRTLLDVPFAGVCSISTAQWSLGILGLIPLPCFETNDAAKLFNVLYETPPFNADYVINGPIQADIWVSTTSFAGTLSVRVDDVAPDGTSTPITNGLMNLKARAVDDSRSRTLDGESIQPWHSFTQDAERAVYPSMIMKIPVEIFPTSAVIKAGHTLRIAVGPSNIPQGVATGLDGLLQLAPGLLTVYSDYWHPSSVVLPNIPADSFTLVPK